MQIALLDLPKQRFKLYPFSLTRPVGDLRVGILTIREKWEKHLNQAVGFLTTGVIGAKYAPDQKTYDLIINGVVCPDESLVRAIHALESNQTLYFEDELIAAKVGMSSWDEQQKIDSLEKIQYTESYCAIRRVWDLFSNNKEQLRTDFTLLTKGRKSAPLTDKHTIVYGAENLFIEEGVDIKAAIFNAEEGPIYLGKNSIVQEGATIRGPFALGENSRINMNAKIREGVTIGPNCKIGGEVSNSIIYGNSNKAHDGYLGNAVIGEWCNLGADTNNSNLKNNYDEVKVWDHEERIFVGTGLQFCGLFMGDHSKSAINTMFNTGTIVGVCTNIFGSGFPRTHIPSFRWGGAEKTLEHEYEKAIETVRIVMGRKNITLTDADEMILKTIFDLSTKK